MHGKEHDDIYIYLIIVAAAVIYTHSKGNKGSEWYIVNGSGVRLMMMKERRES